MVAVSPQVHEVRLEPVTVTKSEVWLRFKDKVLVLKKKGRNEYALYVLSDAKTISSYLLNPTCDGIVVDDVDVCQALCLRIGWLEHFTCIRAAER